MRKVTLLLVLFFQLLIVVGQPVPSVGSYNVVSSASICKTTEGFGIRSLNPNTLLNSQWPSAFTISLEIFVVNSLPGNYNPLNINYPWPQNSFPDCIQGIPGNNPIRIDNVILGGGAGCGFAGTPGAWNSLTERFDFGFTCNVLNSNLINIDYSVYLDCSLLSMINSGSLHIVEKWYYNGLPLLTQNLVPVPITFPHILPVVPVQQYLSLPAPNGQTAEWIFVYENNGNTDANIIFEFNIDACPAYNLTDIFWTTQSTDQPPYTFPGSPNYTSGGTPATIGITPNNKYLIIKQVVEINGCASDCDPVYANFRWKCNDPDPNNCDECQADYQTQIVFTNGLESYTVRRITPSEEIATHNTECQGEITDWKFEVENTGQTVLDKIDVKFSLPNNIISLSLIESSNITVTASNSFPVNTVPCASCVEVKAPVLISPVPPALSACIADVPNPVKEFSLSIHDIPPGIVVTIEFEEYHCCSEDISLLNAPKNFNQWKIQTTCVNVCEQILPPDQPSIINQTPIISPPNGISGYSTVPPTTAVPDLNLVLGFSPMTSHLTVPFYDPPPYYAPAPEYFQMHMDGLFVGTNDEQALGYSASPPDLVSGILKVAIYCGQGLGISDPSHVYFQFPAIPGPPLVFNHEYAAPITYNCTNQTYIFYFRISNAPVPDPATLFSDGTLVFGLTACCPFGTNPVDYNVTFSLLRNEDCFNFSNGSCSPISPNADCCWLPLSSKGKHIQVHCPGCRAPGVIVDKYEIYRSSLGYEDVNDNGRRDNNNRIDFMPGISSLQSTYPGYPYMNFTNSVYGDSLEDFLTAHFEDGSVTSSSNSIIGYEYDDMKAQNIHLNVLHLYREMPYFGGLDMNVQISGFDFYIDDPSLTGLCIDKDKFHGSTSNTPTGLKISIDLSQYTPPPNFFERGTGNNDHRMLFTFDEAFLNTLTSNPPAGVSVNFYNSWSPANIDYDINQQYRLRVRFAVCGNLHDPDWDATAANIQKESSINNFMFLTGTVVDFDDIDNYGDVTTLQAPNACPDLQNENICLVPPCSTFAGCDAASQANLGNAYYFYCEPSGADHYFNSTDMINYTRYFRDDAGPDCKGYMLVSSVNSFARGGLNSIFKFEYKQPRKFPSDFNMSPPPGWNFYAPGGSGTPIAMSFTSSTQMNNGVFSPVQAITNVNEAPSISFDLSAFTFNCLDQTVSTPFIGDEFSCQNVQIWLERIDCEPPLPPGNPPYYDVDDSEVEFSDNLESCSFPYQLCGTNYTQNNMAPDEYRYIYRFDPSLTGTIYPAVFSAISGTVSWNFEIKNIPSPSNPVPTAAKNVYIYLPGVNYLNNWNVSYKRRIFNPFNGNPIQDNYSQLGLLSGSYCWLNPTLSPAHNNLPVNEYYEGTITADYTCENPPPTFDFIWGWNCRQVPNNPSVADLCQEEDEEMNIQNQAGSLTAFTHNYSPGYFVPCGTTPIVVQAFFYNINLVEVHPEILNITLNSNLTISNVTITDVNGIPHPDYNLQYISGNMYNITDAGSADMMGIGEIIGIKFEVMVGCDFGALQMPVVMVSGLDVCGSSFSTNYNLPFMNSSGPSLCTDCYQIFKTAVPQIVQGGDPVTFEITVQGNNANPTTVNLNDLLPPFFNAAPPINFPIANFQVPASPFNPAIQQVTGIFTQIGTCPDANFTNEATIIYPSGSQSASVCVDVICPDPALADYHVTATDHLASLVFGGNPPPGSEIVVDDLTDLIIDIPITFDNCTVVMGSGSSITVSPGITFTLNNQTLIYSCPQMWQGIRVMTNAPMQPIATVNVVNSTIKDANEAIYAEENTAFRLIDSEIINCVSGVVTDPVGYLTNTIGYVSGSSFGLTALSLKGAYSGQPMHGSVGRAGMILNDIVMVVGDNNADPNQFFNINYGIEVHNSNIDVINCKFDDIVADATYSNVGVLKPFGCAVNARSTRDRMYLNVFPLANSAVTTVTNSPVGVYTNFYNARVASVSMDDVIRGVYSEESKFCTVSVTDCDIHAKHRGIDWINNDMAHGMIATGNTIVVEPPSGGAIKGTACISMAEANPGNQANYNVSFNPSLTTISANAGIIGSIINGAIIEYNTINTTEGLISSPGTSGIALLGGSRCTTSCNNVTNTVPSSNLSTTGMLVSQSSDNEITCNDFNASARGMYFGGSNCINTIMKGNLMNNGYIGLYLDNSAVIDPQPTIPITGPYFGNKWTGTFGSSFGAVNMNTQQGMSVNLFTVRDPAFGGLPQHNPLIPLNQINQPFYVDNSGWFDLQPSGATFDCSPSPGVPYCGGSLAGGGGEGGGSFDLRMSIAQDDSITVEYIPESKAVAKQYLFNELAQDSILLASHIVFQNFSSNNLNSAIGRLHSAKNRFAELGNISVGGKAVIQTSDSLIKWYLDDIYNLDSLAIAGPFPNYLNQRQNFINLISIQNQNAKVIIDQQNSLDSIHINLAGVVNNLAVTTDLPHTNEKYINEKLLYVYAGGINIIAPDYSQILAIAMQCPYSGGPAVYRARILIEMLGGNEEYDDAGVCLQSGFYRHQNLFNSDSIRASEIKIIPNPANTEAEIILSGTISGICKLIVSDMLGKIHFENQFNCEQRNHKIDLKNLSPGLYSVSVRINNAVVQNIKLVIAR